jgi:NADH dehydrogenase
VRRFVYASSASVYALEVPVPTPEDAPLRPESHYGRSKLLAEQAIATAGVPFNIVRPSVIYGPGDRYFTPAALRLLRLPLLPLVNGGRTLLDLIYVQDVAEFLWQVAQAEVATGRVYNAGPGVPTSLRDLAAAYQALTGRGPTILPVPAGVPSWSVRWLGPPLRPVLAAAL